MSVSEAGKKNNGKREDGMRPRKTTSKAHRTGSEYWVHLRIIVTTVAQLKL